MVFSVGAACWVASNPSSGSIVASMARAYYRKVPVTSMMNVLPVGDRSLVLSSAVVYCALSLSVIFTRGAVGDAACGNARQKI